MTRDLTPSYGQRLDLHVHADDLHLDLKKKKFTTGLLDGANINIPRYIG